MRILQIRFKNLNSLVGEWSIDLTQPEYLSDGLFAITGPTGAGKSTILDAICLGLYGSTPRLGRITKSANDIMSRHTGECFAQITFETQHGQFESTWSQHRARKKAEGELQNPQHKLINLTKKQTIAEKLTEVGREIENATGLDFERFTRSILLAQGSFAAFLHASSDDRAPILEQITGTQIYSAISIKVYERTTAERKKLTQLQGELKALKLLDAQEEQQLNEQLNYTQTQAHDLTTQIKAAEAALLWLQQLTELQKELDNIEQAQHELVLRQQTFAPEQQRLQRALKALELAGDYQPLALLRTQVAEQVVQQQHLAQQLPSTQTQVQLAQTELSQAQNLLQQAKENYATKRPILNQVIELDINLEYQTKQVQQLENSLATTQIQYSTLQQTQLDLTNQLSKQQKLLDQVLDYLSTHQADEVLVAELAGLQQRFKQLQVLQNTLDLQKLDEAKAQQEHTQLAQEYQKATEELQHSTAQVDVLNTKVLTTQQQLSTSLQGNSLNDWYSKAHHSKERLQVLEQVQTHFNKQQELTQNLETLQQVQSSTQTQLNTASQDLQLKQAQQETFEAKVNHLTERQALEALIQSLEQHRHALEDGKACPLCGALEHPYAQGNLPIQSDTAKQLAEAKALLKQSTKTIQDQQTTIQQLQADSAKQLERISTYQEQLNIEYQALNQLIQVLELPLTEFTNQAINDLIQSTHTQLKHIQSTIDSIEILENSLKALNTELVSSQSLLNSTKEQHQKTQFELNNHQQLLKQLQEKLTDSENQLKHELSATELLLSTFSTKSLTTANLSDIEKALIARRTQWLKHLEQKTELEKQLAQFTQQQLSTNEKLQSTSLEVDRLRAQLAERQSEHLSTRQQRQSLLSNEVVEQVEKQFTQAIEQAELQTQEQRQLVESAQQVLNQLQASFNKNTQDIKNSTLKLNELEENFKRHLANTDFTTEADYQDACLSEQERHLLQQKAQHLQNTATELATKAQDKKLQLGILQAKQLSTSSLAEIQQQCNELKTQQTDLLQTIGALQNQLDNHQQEKLAQEKQIQAIEVQRKESTRWEMLASLIGSADGKKYRNFAQGLTFEIMIHHANKQLRKMSERYLLVRNNNEPLELNVLDTYQAGEIRSTRNLSGGESFLVSLALALGLSHMASQNVRVDSLFLDEGFGTLDQEALETALETLSNLQQEGKLIGIISHVQALQERISTQIKVSPQTGGRSTLKGIGCTQVL